MEIKQDNDNREQKRVNTIKQRYGESAFKEWGKKGGSPILLQFKEEKQSETKADIGEAEE